MLTFWMTLAKTLRFPSLRRSPTTPRRKTRSSSPFLRACVTLSVKEQSMNQIHSPERVKAIRDSAAAHMRSVTDLEARMEDPYFRGRLQQIRYGLEDVESFFLVSLTRESRTPAQESTWLDYT